MADKRLEPIEASILDLAWLDGRWLGTRGEDVIEEHWSSPSGGSIMGCFRWLRDGKVFFYEMLAIEDEDGKPVMRIKHFYPGLKGWEEKDESVTLDLVFFEGSHAAWLKRDSEKLRWLVYEREGDQLRAWFEKEAGVPQDGLPFAYELVTGGN